MTLVEGYDQECYTVKEGNSELLYTLQNALMNYDSSLELSRHLARLAKASAQLYCTRLEVFFWKARNLPIIVRLVFCTQLTISQHSVHFLIVAQAIQDKQLSYGRETARSLILFRLTSGVIRKIIHKMGFLVHPMGHQGQYMRFI